jgi:hypothetical protein
VANMKCAATNLVVFTSLNLFSSAIHHTIPLQLQGLHFPSRWRHNRLLLPCPWLYEPNLRLTWTRRRPSLAGEREQTTSRLMVGASTSSYSHPNLL